MHMKWTESKLKKLKELRQQRLPLQKIADYFGSTADAIQKINQKYSTIMGRYNNRFDSKKDTELLPYDGDCAMEKYNKFEVISGDAMVIGDTHIPFHDIEMMNKMIKIAKRDKITTLIVGGDLTDQKTTSIYPNLNTERVSRKLDDEFSVMFDVLKVLTKTFKQIVLICGDHDSRILRRLDYVMNWKSLGALCNRILKVNSVRSSDYYYGILKSGNQTWRITHPDRATNRSTTKALKLAHKFDQNILQLHGHNFGMEFTVNAKYLAVSMGCMTDREHHEYVMIRDSAHSVWRKQFAKIQNGKITVFDKNGQLTDWDKELGNLNEKKKNKRKKN